MNRIIVSGFVGRNAEFKVLPSGINIVEFSLADGYKVKEDKKTNWWNVKSFDNARVISEAAKTGAMLKVDGRVQLEEYTGKDGVKKTRASIIANDVSVMCFERKDVLSTAKGPLVDAVDIDLTEVPF